MGWIHVVTDVLFYPANSVTGSLTIGVARFRMLITVRAIQHGEKILDNPHNDKTSHMDILNRWVRRLLPG